MNKKLEAFCFALIGGAVATVADIAVSAYAARKYERYLHDDNDDPNPGEDCAGVDNDLDAFEDIFQDEPENQQPQVDLAALQQIRNDAYQNGYSAGYSAGYNNGASTGQQQGYQAGYAAAASAAAEQVQDAYKEGKLDVYDALNPEGTAHDDADVMTEPDAPAPADAMTEPDTHDSAESKQDAPADDECHNLVRKFIDETKTDGEQLLDSVSVATVLRAVLYAKGLPNEGCSGRDALQAALDNLKAASVEEQFEKVIRAAKSKKANKELKCFLLLKENNRDVALSSTITRLAVYLQNNPA